MSSQLPIRDDKAILEEKSELYFKQQLPKGWYADKPKDYGNDLNVNIVQNNQVTGLNFSVQLKATEKAKRLTASIKTTTLNLLLNRLEPTMVILYVENENRAYWRWITNNQFDFSKNQKTHTIQFDSELRLENIDWEKLYDHVQKTFKVQKHLLTSLEYDLFSRSEIE